MNSRIPRLPISPASAPDSKPARSAARQQLLLVRRRAQPTAAYITRLTGTAVIAYLVALLLPGSSRPVLAPLTALLVVQATLYQTIRSAVQRVVGVTVGVLAAVALAAYVPFSWWVLGLLIAATLGLGIVLRLGNEILEVPVSAMLIFAVDSHAAATLRVEDTLVGAAAGLAAGLLFAPMRVQPAREAVGDLTRQMSELLGTMASGLAQVPDPRRASQWLESTRALRSELERLDDALAQAEESLRLNPRRLLLPNPAAGLREGVDTLERAATDMRVLSRAIADSTKIDSDDSPVRDPQTRARLAAVLGELSAAVRAYGRFIESGSPELAAPTADPDTTGLLPALDGTGPLAVAELRKHLAEAHRRQDQLADALRTDPGERPDGWPLRGEILAHVDRLRSELEPRRPPDRTDTTGPLARVGRKVRRGRIRLPRTARRSGRP